MGHRPPRYRRVDVEQALRDVDAIGGEAAIDLTQRVVMQLRGHDVDPVGAAKAVLDILECLYASVDLGRPWSRLLPARGDGR
jgi:hypothetical protein